ncbi:MAG: ribosome maturation factor RimP [Eubacterium sp.]|nr:ribosome maturation factor RimP [Eubacterium sp.]
MADKKEKITELVSSVLSDFLDENGLELYHTDFRKEGKDWYLNVYIDIAESVREENEKNGEVRYVSTDDCELVSDYLSERLDEIDPIEQNYMLQVSSPGMDRELYEQKDFDRFAGELVDVKLYKASSGKKEIQGILKGLVDGNIIITDEEGNERSFSSRDVAKTCLAVVF